MIICSLSAKPTSLWSTTMLQIWMDVSHTSNQEAQNISTVATIRRWTRRNSATNSARNLVSIFWLCDQKQKLILWRRVDLRLSPLTHQKLISSRLDDTWLVALKSKGWCKHFQNNFQTDTRPVTSNFTTRCRTWLSCSRVEQNKSPWMRVKQRLWHVFISHNNYSTSTSKV